MGHIIGIGVDMEEIRRFKKLSLKNNSSFYKRTFTDHEVNYCLSKAEPQKHFCARFAGKEAVIKSLGRHVQLQLCQIEIINKPNPSVNFLDIKNETKKRLKGIKIEMSITHTVQYALAVAVAFRKV